MSRFSDFGNDLYTGRRSIDFVGKARTWFIASVVLLALTLVGLGIRGINLGIEFTGGSDFRVTGVSDRADYEARAADVVSTAGGVEQASVTGVGDDGIRVQTERFDDRRAIDVRDGLAKEFGVPSQNVTSSVIGPSWGQSVTNDAVRALLLFLVLVSIVLALYFRTWKMALAALVALLHDMIFTVGVYAVAGFEVTPASAIGFLTILGYSMYDTVVVFDKVRENTAEAFRRGTMSYAEACNLAVNQTLVRSINTSIVALLPVAVILVMSAIFIGPGTLRDLSLALFIGIAVGTYSSVFIATPLFVLLRRREKPIVALAERVEQHREKAPEFQAASAVDERIDVPTVADDAAMASPVGASTAAPSEGVTATGRPVHPYARRAQGEEGRNRRERKKWGEK